MTADSKTLPAGPKACEAIAHTMIGHFATRLEVEAKKAGGTLSAEAIRALAERFVAEEAARFTTTFRRSFDDCTASREARQWDSARRRPFDRLLMKTFAHLFPPRQGDDGGQGILSRRMINGFNLAIDKMIGPMLLEQCQRKCQAIMDRYKQSNGAYDWQSIHQDAEARALIGDVLIALAHSFANFAKRRDWFLTLINSHLTPVAHGAPDEHWQLTNYGFAELMRALFKNLRDTITHDPEAAAKRYGEHAVDAVRVFFKQMDQG